MFQCIDERHFFLDMFVFTLGLLHVSDVQLDHLHRYQLTGVRQATPNLQVITASGSTTQTKLSDFISAYGLWM